ncbi:MAG: CoA transferase, partial [Acidimicrobiales bacterium]|nr:CoA transferase [Acidimicrobiales bacterium]
DDGDGPTSTYYLTLNRNKRSIALDLRRPDDLAVARRIALGADVVVDNFRPGTMGHFGLDRASLAAEQPSIITCSVTGLGSSGPGGDLAGYDFLVQAMSGLMHVTGEVDGGPSKVGSAVVDKFTGLYAAIGILAALEERRETGLGQHVEVSLMQSALAGLLNVASAHVAADVDPGRHGNRHPSIAPYEPYRAADGMVVVAAASPVLWERFADVLGRPERCDAPRFADNEGRVANVEALATEVEAVLVDGSVEEWVGRLQAAGIPAGPINDVRSAFATAEALGQAPVAVLGEGAGAVRSVRSPMGLSATPPSVRRPPPRNDQHGDEIRDGLGD